MEKLLIKNTDKTTVEALAFMFRSFFSKNIMHEKVIRIESSFPSERPSGFHNAEIRALFEKIENYVSYTPHRMTRFGYPGTIGVTEDEFQAKKHGYLKHYGISDDSDHASKIKYLSPRLKIKAQLAHTTFLSHAFILAPYFEKNKIPFIFNLYPGGGFGWENSGSDDLLKKISDNRYFRQVIVNSELIRDYLIRKNIFSNNQIETIFGVSLQFLPNEYQPKNKKRFRDDKDTFDICFVAYNYDGLGKSKGYDLFVEAAEQITKNKYNEKFRFHVVGNFDENTIPLETSKSNFFFHGIQESEWLKSFYHNMDAIICPNRPNLLYTGSFDGFPMGGDATVLGVATFESDVMGVNNSGNYFEENEFVKINLCSDDIAKKLLHYYDNPDELYQVAERGRQKSNLTCSLEKRIIKISQVIERSI